MNDLRNEDGSATPSSRAFAEQGFGDRPFGHLLLVASSPDGRELEGQLTGLGYGVQPAASGAQGLQMAVEARPDLVLAETRLPDMDGFELCRRLTGDEDFQPLPVVLIAEGDSIGERQAAFEAGAADFLGWPYSERELAVRIQNLLARQQAEATLEQANELLRAQLAEIRALQASLRDQNIRDGLTGLFNRLYLQETLDRELSRASREGKPLCVVMIDIDGLRAINAESGVSAGDQAIQALGDLLWRKTRIGDVACRYGGDEFVVVMPGAGLETALRRAEQLRQDFVQRSAAAPAGERPLTVTLGVVEYPRHGETTDRLLLAAAGAVQAARAGGPGRVGTPEA